MFTQNESTFLIAGPVGALELLTQSGDGAGRLIGRNFVAVIAHPHPLHGGTMSNKVVSTLARTYRQLGVASVRFNFRGVGQSEGQFDQGHGELDDLLAVCEWVQAQQPQAELLLAGFSFGSAMAAAASFRLKVRHLTLIAPPVERYVYDQHGSFSMPLAVVIGDQDELVDVPGVLAWFETLRTDKQLLVIPETGHFFHGELTRLKSWLALQLEQQFLQSDSEGVK